MAYLSEDEKKKFVIQINNKMKGFIFPFAVPIIAYKGSDTDPKEVTQIGTGTLLSYMEKNILLTVKHNFECMDYEYKLAFFNKKDTQYLTVIDKNFICKDEKEDIAFVDLGYCRSLGISKASCLDFSRFCELNVNDINGWFYVYGYPSEKSKTYPLMKALETEGFGYVTARFDKDTESISKQNFNPNRHFLLLYSKDNNIDEHGNFVESPDIHGLSGSAVWIAYKENTNSNDWAPELSRMIGVQTGYFEKSGAVKCISWDYIVNFLNDKINYSHDKFLIAVSAVWGQNWA